MEKKFNDENFQADVIEASKAKPVLVDFFASWCGPCKLQGPIIEEIAGEIGDKAIVGKLNTEEGINASGEYGVMSIPTIIIFKDGQAKETFVGLQAKDFLLDAIKKYFYN